MYTSFVDDLMLQDERAVHTPSQYLGSLPKILECSQAEACLGGINATCSDKYTGPLCAQCSAGHWLWAERCIKCPSVSALASGLAIVGLILFVGVGYLVISGIKAALSSNALPTHQGRTPVQQRYDTMVMLVKSSVGFYQVLAEVREQLGSSLWPSVWNKISLYLQVVSLKFDILECFSEDIRINPITSLKAS